MLVLVRWRREGGKESEASLALRVPFLLFALAALPGLGFLGSVGIPAETMPAPATGAVGGEDLCVRIMLHPLLRLVIVVLAVSQARTRVMAHADSDSSPLPVPPVRSPASRPTRSGTLGP